MDPRSGGAILNYREFVTLVQEKAKLQTYDDAAQATEEVVRSLAQIIPRQRVQDLFGGLPEEIRTTLAQGSTRPDCLIDREVFLGWLMNQVETAGMLDRTLGGYDSAPNDASSEVERRISAVLSVFKSQMSKEQRRELAALLPHDIRRWFRSV